jgi:hypothetical protein
VATRIKARQGTVLRYRFSCYNPLPSGEPDLDDPYDFTDYVARLTIRTPALVVYLSGVDPEVTLTPDPAVVEVVIPATVTATWSQGELSYELEMVPPTGEQDAFALVYGTITMGKQLA